MGQFAQDALLDKVTVFYNRRTRALKAALDIAAACAIIIALARPQWGFRWTESAVKGLDVIIAVDTSKSMLATDTKPNRLTFAKIEIKNFVKKLKGDRIGLIAFSGNSFLQCPLTVDYGGFVLALENLSVDTIPRGGTSIAKAVEGAVKAYEDVKADDKILIVISDGEKTTLDDEKNLAAAKKMGIEISCIGVGTKEGEYIPLLDEKGNRFFLKDKYGRQIRSSLSEESLKRIADATGGVYVRAREANFGLDEIYKERLAGLKATEAEAKRTKIYKERFVIPLCAAFLFLSASLLLNETKGNEEF